MFINIADLMTIIATICDELPHLNANPEKWALQSVDKSWSHYKELERFNPAYCFQLSHFRDDLEWNFLIRTYIDAEEYFPGNPWEKATGIPTDDTLTCVLTIKGEPIKTYQEQTA